MKLTIGKKILISVTVLVATLWVADEYPAMRFRGDGKFSGGPILGYEIKFREIPFYLPGEYTFHFRGMPHEDLALELHAEGKNADNEAELRVKTVLEASIVTERGQSICQASGPPLAYGQNPNGWVVMLAGHDAAYWHWNCTSVEFEPSDSYTMTLRIRDVDPKTPKINLLPVLRGGPDWP